MMRILILIISLSMVSHRSSALKEIITPKVNSDYESFRSILNQSRNVLVLTGPGILVESGIPTFEGVDRIYRKLDSHVLAHPDTFNKSPSLVWEFYHYRRSLVLSATPNQVHYAIAEFERECNSTKRNFTLITQNQDELHRVAGSKNVLELLGTIFRTRCTVCGDIQPNYDDPVCPAFKNMSINPSFARNATEDIPVSELPRCKKNNCNALLRPDLTWITEPLDKEVVGKVEKVLASADVCLVIGCSSVVEPAAEFPLTLSKIGVPVAEFNSWTTLNTRYFRFHFGGPVVETVPKALKTLQNYRTNGTNAQN